jgi:arylsulfatase A-like enzyme
MIARIIKNRLFTQWIQQLINTTAICGLYIFMQWIYLVTIPSMLSRINWGEKFLVLSKGFVIFSNTNLILLIFLSLISLVLPKKWRQIFLNLSSILPAFILAGMVLQMIDNFTYTAIRRGIFTSQGFFRVFYAVLFLSFCYLSFRLFKVLLSLKIKRVVYKLAAIGVIILAFVLIVPKKTNIEPIKINNHTEPLPNIILIGSDGLSADHMSLYGYYRETTPNIDQFTKDALVVKNAFSNSRNSSGSVISILSSKYPSKTRVLFPPDMLIDDDAIQHLPAILKELGYYNAEFSVPHYEDAFSAGMVNSFDEVNGHSAKFDTYTKFMNLGFSVNDSYFLASSIDRLSTRLQHAFFIKTVTNVYSLVNQNMDLQGDKDRINSILNIFDSHPDEPLFIHAHLMGTHGEGFNPALRKFSVGIDQDQYWMIDFYDDSILSMDALFADFINELNARGKLENSVIIFYSDHGEQGQIDTRIPLFIRFPHGEYKDIVINQGENLDISPTILDYLNVDIPKWMDGISFLGPDYVSQPVIGFGATGVEFELADAWIQSEKYFTPPFYQFGFISVVYCQEWYRLDLNTYELSKGDIEHFSNPCPSQSLLTTDEAMEIIRNRLIQDGFEIPAALEESYTFVQGK